MGTQQLLLIVLGVIVVGISVAMGFTIFGSNADQANKDAITQDCLRMAVNAQEYYMKPTLLGGGSNSFTGITVVDCGMAENPAGSGNSDNLNGLYSVVSTAGTDLDIIGTSHIDPAKIVTVSVDMTAAATEDRLSVAYAGW